jgi:hypothetical protein
LRDGEIGFKKDSYLGRDIAAEIWVCVLRPGAANIVSFVKDLEGCIFEF